MYGVAPLAGAWIEIPQGLHMHLGLCVAPLAGAWIEIIPEPPPRSMRLSHPLRVRGLKCRMGRRKRRRKIVAPLAGAWIEIFDYHDI
mgnify:CR=1 FL=1